MFIRPAMSESQFDHDDSLEWGTSDPFDPSPVPVDVADRLVPHPSSCPPTAPTAREAWAFWDEGGWDDLA